MVDKTKNDNCADNILKLESERFRNITKEKIKILIRNITEKN